MKIIFCGLNTTTITEEKLISSHNPRRPNDVSNLASIFLLTVDSIIQNQEQRLVIDKLCRNLLKLDLLTLSEYEQIKIKIDITRLEGDICELGSKFQSFTEQQSQFNQQLKSEVQHLHQMNLYTADSLHHLSTAIKRQKILAKVYMGVGAAFALAPMFKELAGVAGQQIVEAMGLSELPFIEKASLSIKQLVTLHEQFQSGIDSAAPSPIHHFLDQTEHTREALAEQTRTKPLDQAFTWLSYRNWDRCTRGLQQKELAMRTPHTSSKHLDSMN